MILKVGDDFRVNLCSWFSGAGSRQTNLNRIQTEKPQQSRYSLFIFICISKKSKNLIYIIKQDIRIYIYMLLIAGQTAGPIVLKFFVDTHGWPGGIKEFKKFIFCRSHSPVQGMKQNLRKINIIFIFYRNP